MVGFCVVSVAGVPPGNDQDQLSGVFVLLSVKLIQVPWQKFVAVAVKLVTVSTFEIATN